MRNEFIISQDFEIILEELKEKYKDKILKFFLEENFLLEHAKELLRQAYIAESKEKLLIIAAKNFTIEAQNSLLKLIEEPPRKVYFKIISDNKNKLLPTLLSRLQLSTRTTFYQASPTSLNYKNLTYSDILAFLADKNSAKEALSKFELKELFKNMLNDCFKQGIVFTLEELAYINELMLLIELNTKARAILSPFLILLLNKAKK